MHHSKLQTSEPSGHPASPLRSPPFQFPAAMEEKEEREGASRAGKNIRNSGEEPERHRIDKYLMVSESRLFSSKAVSAIQPDLGVFSVSLSFFFLVFLDFFPCNGVSYCVRAGRWINKRPNGNGDSIGAANVEGRGNGQLDERDKCRRNRPCRRH